MDSGCDVYNDGRIKRENEMGSGLNQPIQPSYKHLRIIYTDI